MKKIQPILNSINNAKGILSIHISDIIDYYNSRDRVSMEYWLRRAKEDSTTIANGIEQLKMLSKTFSNKIPKEQNDGNKLQKTNLRLIK